MSLRRANKRGRELRHDIQDLGSLISGGMRSPTAEEFVGVMQSGVNLLAQAIHHKEPLDPFSDRTTADMVLVYRNILDDEALGRAARIAGLSDQEAASRLQDGSWDPFTDE